jgi:hypothetical protein
MLPVSKPERNRTMANHTATGLTSDKDLVSVYFEGRAVDVTEDTERALAAVLQALDATPDIDREALENIALKSAVQGWSRPDGFVTIDFPLPERLHTREF